MLVAKRDWKQQKQLEATIRMGTVYHHLTILLSACSQSS